MELTGKWLVTLVVVCTAAVSNAVSSRHMDRFIRAVQHIECRNPSLEPLELVRGLRRAAGYQDAFTQHFLGALDDNKKEALVLDSKFSKCLGEAIRHRVTDRGEEEGVFLLRDGTTVALEPLLLGIEAGLLAKTGAQPPGLLPLALAKNLGQSFLWFHDSSLPESLGPNGCWDSVSSPKVFTLSGPPSLATDALINGGMDGVVLGTEVAAPARHPLKLSVLLRRYYCHRPEGRDRDAVHRLVSNLRRENFRELVSPALLREEVLEALLLNARLRGDADVLEPEAVVKDGVQMFVQRYMECPTIIPRCQWGAEPYRGTPTQLTLPLGFMYIHHTYQPGQPCLSFEKCAADMRAMQRFHQNDRGWDDIGYSFVMGSDGYLYEGRGWHWQGAHTLGHNSKGYGVSFIGDYTTSLPSPRTLEVVRDRLAECAVGGGRLVADFALQGHRQLVNTSCPGDALYSEIKGWKHFKEVQTRRQSMRTTSPEFHKIKV